MSQIKSQKDKDDLIVKKIIQRYIQALEERGDIVFLALPFAEEEFGKNAEGKPLYIPSSCTYYLKDWVCVIDGVTYVVKGDLKSYMFRK